MMFSNVPMLVPLIVQIVRQNRVCARSLYLGLAYGNGAAV